MHEPENLYREPQKPKTINHRGTETQRKARKAKVISGLPAFDFLCVSVPLWLVVLSFLFIWKIAKWHHPVGEGAMLCSRFFLLYIRRFRRGELRFSG
jgi:hypothetical protein